MCSTLQVWGVPTWFKQAIRTRGGGAGCWGQRRFVETKKRRGQRIGLAVQVPLASLKKVSKELLTLHIAEKHRQGTNLPTLRAQKTSFPFCVVQ